MVLCENIQDKEGGAMTGKITAMLSRHQLALPPLEVGWLRQKIQDIMYVEEVSVGREEKDGNTIHFELIFLVRVDNEGQLDSRARYVVEKLNQLKGSRYSFFGYRKEMS